MSAAISRLFCSNRHRLHIRGRFQHGEELGLPDTLKVGATELGARNNVAGRLLGRDAGGGCGERARDAGKTRIALALLIRPS
jgi:hypothetical protein